MYGLQGRRAIVTGAAHGIGRGIATRLATEGCELGLFDLDLPAVERLAGELSRSGHRVAVAPATCRPGPTSRQASAA
jgi:NAD(P)-dependent dehydrogenase (short-subunit alcohol dehydrogenase family)